MGNRRSAPSPLLSESDLNFLESLTKLSRQEILGWHNTFLSESPGGRLDKTHFVTLYTELQPNDKGIEKYAEFVFQGK